MKRYNIYAYIGFILLILTNQFPAQELEINIKQISPVILRIEGKFLNEQGATKDFSFIKNIADAGELANRIENFQTFESNGNPIGVKKLIAGEFQSLIIPKSFQYDVKVAIPTKLTDSAHISWLGATDGLLQLGDLLPQFNPSLTARVFIQMLSDWKIISNETKFNEKGFTVKEIDNAVFLVGKNIRQKQLQIDKTTLSLAINGDWKFSIEEAFEMAGSILSEHKKIFREIPSKPTQIILLPFPQVNQNPDRWRAETRGSTVTIISGALPLKSQAIQRLHEQLRHELFHLWIPNSLALSGNYDWFYEGFTIYQALRTGVELNQIRFDDFLNTLGKAYDLSESQTDSLIEASNQRWKRANNFIYAKGLVVAFLIDLALLRESKGKKSLKDVFGQIYQKHRIPNQVRDGNLAIKEILNSFSELKIIVQSYLEEKSKINWDKDLASLGIESDKSNFGISLKVSANPNGRQRDLLDKLGYNQWRKLGQKTK